MSGPVGAVSVPAVAPSCPMAMMVFTSLLRRRFDLGLDARQARVDMERIERAREDELGGVLVGEADEADLAAAEVVSKTCDGLQSAGVLPSASSTFAEMIRVVGQRDERVAQVRRRPCRSCGCRAPSIWKPMRFMNSMAGMSPKNAEIGGVAPTESPAAITTDPWGPRNDRGRTTA